MTPRPFPGSVVGPLPKLVEAGGRCEVAGGAVAEGLEGLHRAGDVAVGCQTFSPGSEPGGLVEGEVVRGYALPGREGLFPSPSDLGDPGRKRPGVAIVSGSVHRPGPPKVTPIEPERRQGLANPGAFEIRGRENLRRGASSPARDQGFGEPEARRLSVPSRRRHGGEERRGLRVSAEAEAGFGADQLRRGVSCLFVDQVREGQGLEVPANREQDLGSGDGAAEVLVPNAPEQSLGLVVPVGGDQGPQAQRGIGEGGGVEDGRCEDRVPRLEGGPAYGHDLVPARRGEAKERPDRREGRRLVGPAYGEGKLGPEGADAAAAPANVASENGVGPAAFAGGVEESGHGEGPRLRPRGSHRGPLIGCDGPRQVAPAFGDAAFAEPDGLRVFEPPVGIGEQPVGLPRPAQLLEDLGEAGHHQRVFLGPGPRHRELPGGVLEVAVGIGELAADVMLIGIRRDEGPADGLVVQAPGHLRGGHGPAGGAEEQQPREPPKP